MTTGYILICRHYSDGFQRFFQLGRLLVILLLIEWGLISQLPLYQSSFFEAHRLDYYDHSSDHRSWEDKHG
jgi:Fic family protein